MTVRGGVRVCSDAVLRYFWCGFAVIFILCWILARTAVEPRALLALIQCATMSTEAVEVATESEEDVRYRYSGKNPMRFAVFGCISVLFFGFRTPLRSPPVTQNTELHEPSTMIACICS